MFSSLSSLLPLLCSWKVHRVIGTVLKLASIITMFLASCSVFLIDNKRSTSELVSYNKQFDPAIDVDNSAKVELDDNDIDGGCDISGDGGGSDGRSGDGSGSGSGGSGGGGGGGGGDVDNGDLNVLINCAVGESGSGFDGDGGGGKGDDFA